MGQYVVNDGPQFVLAGLEFVHGHGGQDIHEASPPVDWDDIGDLLNEAATNGLSGVTSWLSTNYSNVHSWWTARNLAERQIHVARLVDIANSAPGW